MATETQMKIKGTGCVWHTRRCPVFDNSLAELVVVWKEASEAASSVLCRVCALASVTVLLAQYEPPLHTVTFLDVEGPHSGPVRPSSETSKERLYAMAGKLNLHTAPVGQNAAAWGHVNTYVRSIVQRHFASSTVPDGATASTVVTFWGLRNRMEVNDAWRSAFLATTAHSLA